MSVHHDMNRRYIVLIVEDDDLCRLSVTALLESHGFDVVAVGDGETAIETLQHNPHDFAVVLLDVVLPKTSGADTFRALRRIRYDLPIIVTTGYGKDVVDEQFCGLNYDGFVSKPTPADRLKDVLQTFTQR